MRIEVTAYEDIGDNPTPVVLLSTDEDDMVVVEVGGALRRVAIDDLLSAVAKFSR